MSLVRARAASPSACATQPASATIGLAAIVPPQRADFRIDAVRCAVANVAGVEHDQIGIVLRHGDHPVGSEQFAHPFAVIDIHLTAEGFDMIGFGRGHDGGAPSGCERSSHRRANPRMRFGGNRLAAVEHRGVERLEKVDRERETSAACEDCAARCRCPAPLRPKPRRARRGNRGTPAGPSRQAAAAQAPRAARP